MLPRPRGRPVDDSDGPTAYPIMLPATEVPEALLRLAPTELTNNRPVRYNGGGLGVPLDTFAEPDRDAIRRVYDAVLTLTAVRPGSDFPGRPALDPEFLERLRAVGADPFVRLAQSLGTATAGTSPLARKALHDIRGGALTALVGTAGLLAFVPPTAELLATCGRMARDHCKILRSAVPDLDPLGRAHDEVFNYHGIEKFVRTWDGATVREYGHTVAVAVRCHYADGITASCLENAAVDRVLYNHINNAARFAADGRVALTIFSVGANCRAVRWVVTNAVGGAQREWLAGAVGSDLDKLYAGGLTNGGEGLGLASCVDFVTAAFGLSSAKAALMGRYLGAELDGDEYRAWFHWPAFAPEVPPPECPCP